MPKWYKRKFIASFLSYLSIKFPLDDFSSCFSFVVRKNETDPLCFFPTFFHIAWILLPIFRFNKRKSQNTKTNPKNDNKKSCKSYHYIDNMLGKM